jgi:hypothetical protein
MPGMALSQPAMPLKTVAAPWVTAAEWQAVHQTFRYLIHHHESSLNNIRVSAFRLAELLKIIILMADRLCQSTCRYCPDPVVQKPGLGLTTRICFSCTCVGLIFREVKRYPLRAIDAAIWATADASCRASRAHGYVRGMSVRLRQRG